MTWPLPGWKTLPRVVGSSDRCVCAVPIQAQEKQQEPEQDHRLGQQFQWDLQIHIVPKVLVWFTCVVKLKCLSFHCLVCLLLLPLCQNTGGTSEHTIPIGPKALGTLCLH